LATKEHRTDVLSRLANATAEAPVRLGRYDVVACIGKGGMGTVYDALDREHGNARVALKMLSLLDGQGLVQLKHEFRSMADVTHENLVSLYELACHHDLWFFTMERIDGHSWVRHVRGEDEPSPHSQSKVSRPDEPTREIAVSADDAPDEERPPLLGERISDATLARLRPAFAQLVRGVHALHQRGLVHLDLKPANVLVQADGRVVILDFGLVRSAQDHSGGAGAKGTLMYMAPEQMSGEPVSEPADWYAVGVMLYRALTGRRPFVGKEPVETYIEKTRNYLVPPKLLVENIPEELHALCLSLLAARPDARPTGAELLRVVSEAGSPRAVRRPSTQGFDGFVGRQNELRQMSDAYEEASVGASVVVDVTGPSGIGKTAMVKSFLSGVRNVGTARIFSGRCYERETVPYKAFDGIIDELAADLRSRPKSSIYALLPRWINELARAFPVLTTVDAVSEKLGVTTLAADPAVRSQRTAAALSELMSALSQERLLVLHIDDLHWSDLDSIRLLGALLDTPAPQRILIILSFRPDHTEHPILANHRELVSRQRHGFRHHEIEIGPLNALDAHKLVRSILRDLGATKAEPLAGAIARESTGIPFFVEALARYAADLPEDQLEHAPALAQALVARVRSLPAEARALIEVVAVAGRPTAQSVVFKAALLDSTALPALLSLQGANLLRKTTLDADYPVEVYHDRIRESVLSNLGAADRLGHTLRLGRALAASHPTGPTLFEAVRHLNAVEDQITDPIERTQIARMNLDASARARQAAAYPLALSCIEAGIRFLGPDAWEQQYELALALHVGASEAAYASAAWLALEKYAGIVALKARDVLDQLPAREVEIDGWIARRDYGSAVMTALEVLELLGVDLPLQPTADDVSAAVKRASDALLRVGKDGLIALPDVADARVVAAMRTQTHIASATYFATPMLFPMIACGLVVTSIEKGLSPATPYALSVFSVVLNSLGRFKEAHNWGRLALDLLPRWEDRRLEARTRHVVHDMACVWTVPLSSTLDELESVLSIAKETGDLEYGAYSAHAFVHNAFYAARPLGPLLKKADAIGAFMSRAGQLNALDVHMPVEQIIRSFVGATDTPSRLDGPRFLEDHAIMSADNAGSRSALCLIRLLMGIARYHFGDPNQAANCLEAARPYLDGLASTWHVPILHQYAALARCAAGIRTPRDIAQIEGDIAALRAFAEAGPMNFGHRVTLIDAELARAQGEIDLALSGYSRAAWQAMAGGWSNDAGLAFELIWRVSPDPVARDSALESARAAYGAWGASAKLKRLTPAHR